MTVKHNRKFVPSGIALVMGSLKNTAKTNRQDSVEEVVIRSGMLDTAPFTWIGMNYRYGIKNNLKVDFGRISKKYGDLTISIELDMEILQWADKNNLDLLHDIFMIAALEALLQVCDKYKLPKDVILTERQKYGDIPNTIAECETYQRP